MSILHRNGISLRAVESADTEVIFNIENDTSGWMQSDNYLPFSLSVLERYTSGEHDLFKHGQYRFMIINQQTSETYGCIDLFDYSSVHRRSGVGVYILSDYRNQGYAGSALEILIEYAQKTLNLRVLHCSILENNLKSKLLFESKRFIYTGKRENWFINETDELSIHLFQRTLS